jgi:hypothetical protein
VSVSLSTAWWACTRPALTVYTWPLTEGPGPTSITVSLGLDNRASDPVFEVSAEVRVPWSFGENRWGTP